MSARLILVIALAAAPALAQQPPARTTEQQARSYVASAFITGAAPAIMSEQVIVSAALRQYLSLPPEADGQAAYKAIMNLAGGKQVTVRRAAADEIAQSEAPAPVSQQPVFALEAGSATLIVQYDLARDNISFVGLPGAVATAAPVVAPTPPEKMADTPAVVAQTPPPPPPPAPVEAPQPVAAAAPAVEPQKPAQVVEPQIPRMTQPTAMAQEPPRPRLKPDGPCVIKPVMSDQDLVNCGATPR
jgi:hypothetical protein